MFAILIAHGATLTSAVVMPLLLLAGVVLLVTLVALLRAEKDDIPRVFASFAEAFGVHRRPKHAVTAAQEPEDAPAPAEREDPDDEDYRCSEERQ
ncbi:hypothetical protein [Nocardia tengchongensis]|uniref:hypothetical protein n=1 Tax=Nocardia tengchongensis TaxID=2055889 RepID=UPI0036D0855C